jgi:hypothetical protein
MYEDWAVDIPCKVAILERERHEEQAKEGEHGRNTKYSCVKMEK